MAVVALVVGFVVAVRAPSPGHAFLRIAVASTAGGAASLGMMVGPARHDHLPVTRRGVFGVAFLVGGLVLLVGLVAWAALAVRGCLFNPHPPWACGVGG